MCVDCSLAHLLLVAAGFREQSRYRLAALGGLVANATFGLLKVAILFATVEAAGGELAGYDAATMSAYIWISQGMLGSVNLMGRVDIAERIRTGDVTVDFLRPLDVHTAMIAHELGRSVFSLLPRGLPSVLIGALLVGMATPDSPAAYAARGGEPAVGDGALGGDGLPGRGGRVLDRGDPRAPAALHGGGRDSSPDSSSRCGCSRPGCRGSRWPRRSPRC